MTHDTLIRAAALVAAVAFLATPYWPVIGRYIAAASKTADAHRADLGRIAAAVFLIVAACGTSAMPALRHVEWTVPNVVTALKIAVGMALVARAFVEVARLGHAALDARMRTTP